MKRPTTLRRITCKHPGLDAFREMRAAAREGRAPAQSAVEAIAQASDYLFADAPARDRLEEFGKALGMFRRQGKGKQPNNSAGALRKQILPVYSVIEAERRIILAGTKPAKAATQAVREIAVRDDIPPRTLQRYVRDHRKLAEYHIDVQLPQLKTMVQKLERLHADE